MTPAGQAFLGLTAIVTVLVAILTFAVLKFLTASRQTRGRLRESGVETAFLTAALCRQYQTLIGDFDTTLAGVGTVGNVTLTSSGGLTQTATGDGVKGSTVKLLADGGIGSAAQSVVVATSNLMARSVNTDQFLTADGTVLLTDSDALDAGTATVHLTGGRSSSTERSAPVCRSPVPR